MHYCIGVITEKFPTDEVLQEKLAPFEYAPEYDTPRPAFTWDWFEIGGRYGGLIKLRYDPEDDTDYKWFFCLSDAEERAGRLFRSMMLEDYNRSKGPFRHGEEYFFHYMGSRDGYIHVDGAKIKDIVEFEDLAVNHAYGIIRRDGNAICRQYLDGHKWKDDERYEEKVREAIADVADCYYCIVDIHD